jgi:hypothetical protein
VNATLRAAINKPSRRFDTYLGPRRRRAALLPPSGMVMADFGSGDFLANGTIHEAKWVNKTGKVLHVRKALAWVGPQLGATADVSNIIYRTSDHLIVALSPLDVSYYRGDGDYSTTCDWNRGEVVIQPGDGFFSRFYSLAFKDNEMFGIPINKIVTGFRSFVWMVE